jgi:hypothetical protein
MLIVRAAIAVSLLAASAPLAAGALVLTERGGRPLIVGYADDLISLEVLDLGAQALVDEFARLCLPDPAAAYAKAPGSILAMASDEAILPASGKDTEAKVPVWRGPSAQLSTWNGDDGALKKRPIAILSRAYTVSGQYGPFHAVGAQCNLVLKVRDFAAATQVSDALTAKFGAPGKLVTKRTWADGYWLPPSNPSIRLNYTTPSAEEGARLVHISAQIMEKESTR